jgi:outer membrane protein TolC
MQYRIFKIVLICLFSLNSINIYGQEILLKDEAVKVAMENNFDIKISNSNLGIAKNNASIQNSRYLPTVSASAGGNYNNTDGTVTQKSGIEQDFSGNETTGLNASIGLNYTIFDGFGRSNTYKILQENYHISELQARQLVENTILNIFNSYYEVARLSQDVRNQKQTVVISNTRLQRAKYGIEYGQGSQLDVLNAEVDFNNDSISYLTNIQLLANEKRNLNLLMGRDITIDFTVDTTLKYATGLSLESLINHTKENNVTIMQQELVLQNAAYGIKSNRANAIPKLNVNANYGWNENSLGATSFINKSMSYGPTIGATLSWNIYDGGSTKIKKQNSKITLDIQQTTLEKEKLNIQRNLSNAWTSYQTALFMKDAQKKNLETSQTNFNRSTEQYKLGQITNIEFRQAQLNLLKTQLVLNQAKYNAKLAELFLLQISGDLETAKF